MLVILIDICNLFVDISKLHVIFIHLVVVDHFVNLLDPLIVHKHAVVALGDHFLASYKLVVLGFHTESH
jgi:hypothetical protein